jgi:catechol 2,3-dioxygenase-like lactoylglutathione lyase family enzyme
MLAHVGIYVGDTEKSKAFYTKALAPLGYAVVSEFPEWGVVGFGVGGNSDFWISKKEPQKAHVAFTASSKKMVEEFHAAALAAGGKDNGAPGYRKDYSPGYYAAFAYDPDGCNIEVVFHDPNPGE